jgi:hypothetical protein
LPRAVGSPVSLRLSAAGREMRQYLRELRERVRYLIDRAFAREFAGQLLLFGVLVVLLTLVGMTSVFFGLFSDENADVAGIRRGIDGGLWDSLWWSMHHVLSLRTLERMYGATAPILAYTVILSVAGLAVFGILVSVINNTMRDRIEKLKKGETPVKERGHVLILGWNNKVFAVLRQLARREPGLRVVILAPVRSEEMQDKLRVAGILQEDVTVILRSGIPSNRRELERVAIDRASSVIVLSTDEDDSEAIKTLVLLASWSQWRGERPTLTAEITLEENYELASIAARDRLYVLSSGRVISKMIVQTIRNPGLAAVYHELFSTSGSGIHVERVSACAGQTLGDIAHGFASAIPIGVTWDEERAGEIRHAAGLNPGPDYDLAEDESLVLLARHLPVRYAPRSSAYASSVYQDGGTRTSTRRRVLLIGWSDLIYDVLKELNAHVLTGTSVTLLSALTPEEAGGRVRSKLSGGLERLSLDYRHGDAIEQSAYDGLDLASYQNVVILADEVAARSDVDTRTLRILLRLDNLSRGRSERAHTIVELHDENNRDLLAGLGVDDIIVSPDVISAQLAQIARSAILGPIYHELLSAGGVEISIRPASHYVRLDADCCFDDLLYAAAQKMEIALGLRLAASGREIRLNPERDVSWRLGPEDEILVLAQQVYR